MTVRAAVAGDAAEIGRVQVEVWRQAYDGLMRAERLAAMDPARIGRLWGERLAAPPPGQRTWVALDGEELVAFYERHGFAADGAIQDDEALGVTERRMVRAG